MQPDTLADRIADQHQEPSPLRQFRQQATTDIDHVIAQQLHSLFSPTHSDRLDVSDTIWERIQRDTAEKTTIQPLKEAVNDDPSLLDRLPEPETPIQQLCQAFFTNGIHIHVSEPEDTILQPVFRAFASPRIDLIIIQADNNADASIVEGCSSPRSRPFRAGYTIIDADDQADIRYSNLQHWKDTLLLDSTRSTGDTAADHFIKADRKIIEAESSSRVLTPDTAFQADGFKLTDSTHGDIQPIDHSIDALSNIPHDYRTEIRHILSLSD